MEHTIVGDPAIGKPTLEVDPSAADVRTALPNLFILEDFTTPTTAPVVNEACTAAARILRSEFFRSIFNRAVGKKGPRHNLALSNELTKGFPVNSDASPGAVNFEQYTSLEEDHNASEESSRYICLSPVLLAHINNVLRSLTNNPAHLQAKQNFTALLVVKLVREVSRLLVSYFCPEAKIGIGRKKILGYKEYGDHFETLLFGGIVKLTTWLGFEVALKQPPDHKWSLCVQDFVDSSSAAVRVDSVDLLLAFTPGEVALPATALHLPRGSVVAGRKRKRGTQDPSRGLKTIDKNGNSITIRFSR